MTHPQELEGQVAIVTGGSRGLGLAATKALIGAGAKVVITGVNAERGEAAAAELGPKVRFVRQDVSKSADWPAVMAAAAEFGPLNVMVANAGISDFTPLEAMTIENFRHMMDINLKGSFFSVQHATNAMREHGKGGSIILLSSVMGRMSAPANTHYSGSKAGVRLLMKAAALELGPEQIRVNAILPGITHSDMTADFSEAEMAPMLIPLKRFGEAREIGDAILFAASDRSKFMTGAELVVDGGLVAR